MAESVEKRVNIRIGAAYTGSAAMKSAVADVEKLRKQAELPTMGPLTREQSAVESMLKQRLTAMERAGERIRAKERVEEILFGKGSKGARGVGDKHADSLGRITVEANKATTAMGTLAEMFRKFGTSSGTDPLIERMVKLAPAFGAALAAWKTVSIGLEAGNLAGSFSRHNAQGNLERQMQDESGLRGLLTGIPILGTLAANMQGNRYFGQKIADVRKLVGLDTGKYAGMSYDNQKAAIEELDDQTKAQEKQNDRMEARVNLGKALRETSLETTRAMQDQFAATTAEYGAFLKYAEKFRQLQLGIEAVQRGGNAPPAEAAEAAAMLRQGGIGALVSDGLGRLGGLAGGYASRAGSFLGRLTGRITATRDIDAAIRERRLRDAGRGFEADISGVRAETSQRVYDDPANAAMIREEQAAKESSIAQKYHRQLLDERRDFQRKMEGIDADASERRLRLSGKAYEADKLQMGNAFQAQAAEIKDRYESLIRANPNEAPTLRRRASQEIKAAGEGYAIGMAELMRERGMRFLAGGIATTGGALSTGAVGRGDIAAARERDISQQQLRAVQDQARAIKELPKAIADKIKEMLQSFGLGELGTSEYK